MSITGRGLAAPATRLAPDSSSGVCGVLFGTRQLLAKARDAQERAALQRFTAVSVAVVLLAVAAFPITWHLTESDYEEALWNTVSGLGDRDTTCAIVGGILALHTHCEIPAQWREATESRETMSRALLPVFPPTILLTSQASGTEGRALGTGHPVLVPPGDRGEEVWPLNPTITNDQ